MKLYYYVSNGGDGSANVIFCESIELATVLDDSQDEGWGEPSVGEIEGDNLQVGYIRTLEGEIKELHGLYIHEEEYGYKPARELLRKLLQIKKGQLV